MGCKKATFLLWRWSQSNAISIENMFGYFITDLCQRVSQSVRVSFHGFCIFHPPGCILFQMIYDYTSWHTRISYVGKALGVFSLFLAVQNHPRCWSRCSAHSGFSGSCISQLGNGFRVTSVPLAHFWMDNEADQLYKQNNLKPNIFMYKFCLLWVRCLRYLMNAYM